MRIEGLRPDGVIAVDVGSRQVVLVDPVNNLHTQGIDQSDLDKYGPWEEWKKETDPGLPRQIEKVLNSSRLTDIKHFSVPGESLRVKRYRAMLSELPPKLLTMEADKSAHPFTYCKEVIIPAMAQKGRQPDDPDAFCAWWKQEHDLSMSYDERRQRVDAALRLRLGIPTGFYAGPSDFWIADINAEEVIYQVGGRTYRIMYSIDDNGTVQFTGNAEEVMKDWTPLRQTVSEVGGF